MIIVEIVFSLYFDENNEFQKTKRVFCSVFLSGSDETIVGSKGHLRLFWQFLAIFVKSNKRTSAPYHGRV